MQRERRINKQESFYRHITYTHTHTLWLDRLYDYYMRHLFVSVYWPCLYPILQLESFDPRLRRTSEQFEITNAFSPVVYCVYWHIQPNNNNENWFRSHGLCSIGTLIICDKFIRTVIFIWFPHWLELPKTMKFSHNPAIRWENRCNSGSLITLIEEGWEKKTFFSRKWNGQKKKQH